MPIKNYELRVIGELSGKAERRGVAGEVWEAAGEVCGAAAGSWGGPGGTSHGLGRIHGDSSETSHGLGHFSYPRVQHSSHPTFLAPSRPRTPETAQCGLSVGNKCGWNPEIGTDSQ